jgi:hypothetical protein
MELSTAIQLIENGVTASTVQRWADLGAGSGLFTHALSTLLPGGSSIIAIDKKVSKITVARGINLDVKTADFLATDIPLVDGVLIANALHYVKDQRDFVNRLSAKTNRIILVEYNTDRGNQWIPYPISFNKLKSIYTGAQQIGEARSAYHNEGMYSALLLF